MTIGVARLIASAPPAHRLGLEMASQPRLESLPITGLVRMKDFPSWPPWAETEGREVTLLSMLAVLLLLRGQRQEVGILSPLVRRNALPSDRPSTGDLNADGKRDVAVPC